VAIPQKILRQKSQTKRNVLSTLAVDIKNVGIRKNVKITTELKNVLGTLARLKKI
jgi:hypothetical protein